MRRTFNCGIGMIAAVAAADTARAIELLAASGEEAVEIGRVVSGDGEVRFL